MKNRFEFIPIPKVSTRCHTLTKVIDLSRQISRKPLFSPQESTSPLYQPILEVNAPYLPKKAQKPKNNNIPNPNNSSNKGMNKDIKELEDYNCLDFTTKLRAFSTSPAKFYYKDNQKKGEIGKKKESGRKPLKPRSLKFNL